jgi:hypothetical protein
MAVIRIAAFAALCSLALPASTLGKPDAPKPKAGDWVQYEEIGESSNIKAKITVKITVKSVDKETGKIKSKTTDINGRGENNVIRDLRPSLQRLLDVDPHTSPGGWDKADEVKESEESIKVGSKTYKCQRIDSKGKLPEMAGEWTRTVWVTDEAGFLGWVKSEAITKTKDFLPTKMTRQVIGSSVKKRK